MKTELGSRLTLERVDQRHGVLAWIDARQAIIVRLHGDGAQIERVGSDVPVHHRATGHVRHVPTVRHGGGGSQQTAGEPHRIEHLDRFVADVARRLAADDDVRVLGAGTVHERLARKLIESDRDHGRHRVIGCETSRPMTDRQLVARLRRYAGVEPRRRSVGAGR